MTHRDTADRQLERILYLLPSAAREGGADLAELARRLGVSPDRVLRDLREVWSRVYYHPSGGADDIRIVVEADRVAVHAGDKFRRPPALGLREALALHLGLQMVAAERTGRERERILALARRLGRRLATAPPDGFLSGYRLADGAEGDEIRALLFQAARERRRVRLRYLKPDAGEPEDRALEPWVVAHATGRWYALGRSGAPGEVRAFRLDRIVEVEALEGTFTVPADFDPADYLEEGRVYRAEEETEVTVRYSPRIARWMAERGWGELAEDGSLTRTHRVADPGWAVRHVLRYGPEAEVLEPAPFRELVREVAQAIAAAHE